MYDYRLVKNNVPRGSKLSENSFTKLFLCTKNKNINEPPGIVINVIKNNCG